MRWMLWACVGLGIGCAGGEGGRDGGDKGALGTMTASDGEVVRLRDGFSFTWDASTRGVVLTNAKNACEAWTWHAERDELLWELGSDPYVSDEMFQEAIDNTADVFADEMSDDTAILAILWLDDLPEGEELTLEVADSYAPRGERNPDGVAASVDWYETPEVTFSDNGKSWGGHEEEAYGSGGEVTLLLDDDRIEGSGSWAVQTETLAGFELEADFDLPDCSDWVDASN